MLNPSYIGFSNKNRTDISNLQSNTKYISSYENLDDTFTSFSSNIEAMDITCSSVLVNGENVATQNDVSNEIADLSSAKFDKTGGSITGDVSINGTLDVSDTIIFHTNNSITHDTITGSDDNFIIIEGDNGVVLKNRVIIKNKDNNDNSFNMIRLQGENHNGIAFYNDIEADPTGTLNCNGAICYKNDQTLGFYTDISNNGQNPVLNLLANKDANFANRIYSKREIITQDVGYNIGSGVYPIIKAKNTSYSGLYGYKYSYETQSTSQSNNNQGLILRVQNNLQENDVMVLKHNGNIGINNTNPQRTLDIVGSLQHSGGAYTIKTGTDIELSPLSITNLDISDELFTDSSINRDTLNIDVSYLNFSTNLEAFGITNNTGTGYSLYSDENDAIIFDYSGNTRDELAYILIQPKNYVQYFTDGSFQVYGYRTTNDGYSTMFLYDNFNNEYDSVSITGYNTGTSSTYTFSIPSGIYIKSIVLRLRLNPNVTQTHRISIKRTSTIKLIDKNNGPYLGCTITPLQDDIFSKLNLDLFNNTNISTIQINSDATLSNFTGQHHNYSVDNNIDNKLSGFIVSSTGLYQNDIDKLNNITINESLPIVDLSKKGYDKKIFGVISERLDGENNVYRNGLIGVVKYTHKCDKPLTINSLGEGAIWVCNVNGPIENGDYIVSSYIPGLGMLQNDVYLANYTVAKSTMDCEFLREKIPLRKMKVIPVYKTIFDESLNEYIQVQDSNKDGTLKFEPVTDDSGKIVYDLVFDDSGNQIYTDKYESKYVEVFSDKYVIYNDTEKTDEYYTYMFDFANGTTEQQSCIGNTYTMAFIGCTYHCG